MLGLALSPEDSMSTSAVTLRDHRINWIQSIPFFAFHLFAGVAVFFVPFHWSYVVWAVALYYLRMWAVTAGYHRYFSHRAYKTSRAVQFLLAFLAETSAQKGVLWWAANHRHHHRYSDQPEDIHSPLQDGFWWSHVGWILCRRSTTRPADEGIRDFARFPELRLAQQVAPPPAVPARRWRSSSSAASRCWCGASSSAPCCCGTAPSPSTRSATCSASAATRRPTPAGTTCCSRSITCGEGWHNNHHYHQNTANQGWFWWEVDLSFYALKVLSWLGLVWDLRLPSEAVKYAFRKYSPEEQVAVESMPAIFGKARHAALIARAKVAEAMKGATELAGPAPLPVLKRR